MKDRRSTQFTLVVIFLLFLVLLPSLMTAFSLSYIAYNNSSDTFLYLDIARNIVQGKGFQVSFNNYLFWPGTYYPALPFVHCGLPLFLSLFLPFCGSIGQLVLVNFLLAALNIRLLYTIASRLTEKKTLALCAVFIAVSCVSFQVTLLRILTEQLSLLFTLAALRLFLDERGGKVFCARRIWAGLLLAAGVLVRSSSFLYIFAFAAAILFKRSPDLKTRSRDAVLFLVICLLPLVLFEAALFFQYHVFYPQYPGAFRDFYNAAFNAGGYLSPKLPVVRPFTSVTGTPFFLDNVTGLARVIMSMLRVLVIFALTGLFRVFSERKEGSLVLAMLPLLQAFSLVMFYPYAQLNDFELVRFLLVPVIALLLISLVDLEIICSKFLVRYGKALFLSIIALVVLANQLQSAELLKVYWKEAGQGKVRPLEDLRSWIEKNTAKGQLIAAEELVYGSIYLDRPIVSFLEGKLLNDNNLSNFLSIYHPALVIVKHTDIKDRMLKKAGLSLTPTDLKDGLFSVYRSVEQ